MPAKNVPAKIMNTDYCSLQRTAIDQAIELHLPIYDDEETNNRVLFIIFGGEIIQRQGYANAVEMQPTKE